MDKSLVRNQTEKTLQGELGNPTKNEGRLLGERDATLRCLNGRLQIDVEERGVRGIDRLEVCGL